MDVSPEDEELDTAEGDEETLFRGTNQRHITRSLLAIKIDASRVLDVARQDPDPATIIVRYLAEQPFQAYYRRNKVEALERG